MYGVLYFAFNISLLMFLVCPATVDASVAAFSSLQLHPFFTAGDRDGCAVMHCCENQ